MTDRLQAAAQAVLETWTGGVHRKMGDALRELSAALAEQDAEPVAWGMRHSDGRIYDCIAPGEHDRDPGAYTVPLYTHPPLHGWQSLTGEELDAAVAQNITITDPRLTDAVYGVALTVEAALKEKNHK